jgi:exonuclease SbcC
MIRRITLENYMSHVHTVIEPASGLTVLVGSNNCGKSAVVSALETLCNNASGGYMVRHDEKEASVTVETDDNHTLVWKRRGNTVSYLIDGREISRLKRGVPEDLHKLLRLPKVDGGDTGDPFDIHFGTQKAPIFLLNESASRAALFFASSSDAAILLEMQKRHRNKVKERKNDEKRLNGEIAKLDAELVALEPLDTLAASVAQADGTYQELKALEGQIQTLGKEMEALRAHSVQHDRLVQEYQCLAPLKPPPQLADTSPLESLIADLGTSIVAVTPEILVEPLAQFATRNSPPACSRSFPD